MFPVILQTCNSLYNFHIHQKSHPNARSLRLSTCRHSHIVLLNMSEISPEESFKDQVAALTESNDKVSRYTLVFDTFSNLDRLIAAFGPVFNYLYRMSPCRN